MHTVICVCAKQKAYVVCNLSAFMPIDHACQANVTESDSWSMLSSGLWQILTDKGQMDYVRIADNLWRAGLKASRGYLNQSWYIYLIHYLHTNTEQVFPGWTPIPKNRESALAKQLSPHTKWILWYAEKSIFLKKKLFREGTISPSTHLVFYLPTGVAFWTFFFPPPPPPLSLGVREDVWGCHSQCLTRGLQKGTFWMPGVNKTFSGVWGG